MNLEEITLTPDQLELAKRNWRERRNHSTYEDDLMGPEISPALAAEIAEMEARSADFKPTQQALEALAEQQELNADLSEAYQWVNPKDYADEEARKGIVTNSDQLMLRFRNECHLRCWYGPVQENRYLGLMVQKSEGSAPQYACWVQQGWMPEFEMINFDSHGVPLNSKHRGWRTVLMQLIMKGFLEEAVATRVFGEAVGSAATRYNLFLYQWRNRPRQETAGMAETAVVSSQPSLLKNSPPVSREPEDGTLFVTCECGTDVCVDEAPAFCTNCKKQHSRLADPPEPEAESLEPEQRCSDCNRRIGHNLDCPQLKEI